MCLNKLWCLVNQFMIYKIDESKLGWHLTSTFSIADMKAYLGLQRSDNLNPVHVSIWLAFAECQPESPGLGKYQLNISMDWWVLVKY